MRTRNATLTLEELIETIGDAFKQTYATAELTYIVEIGDSSKLEVEESDESGSGLIDLPIRGYLAAKPASRESWQAWVNQTGFAWTKVAGGSES